MAEARELSFVASERRGEVSALVLRPPRAKLVYVLAHGAGAGMRHAFMEAIADQLYALGIATFRYQFPYMEAGGRRPDSKKILLETVRSAVAAAAKACRGLPMIAGGKSMGGRMTSQAAAEDPLAAVLGLVFLGFPLHAPGREGSERGDHLSSVGLPMLFIQGTRDKLADLDRMTPLCDRLERATMHIVDDGDHSFRVPKRAGRTAEEVLAEIAEAVQAWAVPLV